jgi:hypothetical protein
MDIISASLGVVSLLRIPGGGHLEDGMSCDTLLGAAFLVISQQWSNYESLCVQIGVKKVSIATSKPHQALLVIHLLTTCNPHFYPKNAS